MKEIKVTMEKTIRAAGTFAVTDEEYEAVLEEGHLPERLRNEMDGKILEEDQKYLRTKTGEVEFDYRIEDCETDEILVDWD